MLYKGVPFLTGVKPLTPNLSRAAFTASVHFSFFLTILLQEKLLRRCLKLQ